MAMEVELESESFEEEDIFLLNAAEMENVVEVDDEFEVVTVDSELDELMDELVTD